MYQYTAFDKHFVHQRAAQPVAEVIEPLRLRFEQSLRSREAPCPLLQPLTRKSHQPHDRALLPGMLPLPEWQVDVPTLMALGVRSVSVDVLISEAGVAQQCAVTRIEPQQPPALQLAVASRLCETVLRPAQRHSVAVASVRHIELVLAAD